MEPPSTPPRLAIPDTFERRRSLTHHLSPSSAFYTPAREPAPWEQPAPTLRSQPLLTLRLFSAYLYIQIGSCARSVATHLATALTVYPAIGAYCAAKLLVPEHPLLAQFEVRRGPPSSECATYAAVACVHALCIYTAVVLASNDCRLVRKRRPACAVHCDLCQARPCMQAWFAYVAWWLIQGILSSIGLGSGLHSGLLFLFPHFLKVRTIRGSVALAPDCGFATLGHVSLSAASYLAMSISRGLRDDCAGTLWTPRSNQAISSQKNQLCMIIVTSCAGVPRGGAMRPPRL
jgi:hypothetical protein